MGRKSIFNSESRVSKVLGTLWELIKLNLYALLCCLPLITAGAALTALYAALLRLVKGEESYVSRDYFHAFRENLREATLLWLIKLSFLIPMLAQLLLLESGDASIPRPLTYVVLTAAFAVLILLAYVFPLQASFQNTILGTLGNSFRLSISTFPRALVLAGIWVVPAFLLIHVWALFPLVFFLGISLPGYLCCRLFEPVFRNLSSETPDHEA